MDEQITIQLMQDGRPLQIEQFGEKGIVVGAEDDAWPRSIAIGLIPREDFTRDRLRRVAVLNGWKPWEFNLTCMLEDGILCLRGYGGNRNGLPIGNYYLRLQIFDYNIPREYPITLESGENEQVQVEVRTDPRRVELVARIDDFDAEIRRVLGETGAKLDHLPIYEWLGNPTVRANRKACLLNLLAKLRVTPNAREPLIRYIRRIFFADVDRVYGAVDGTLLGVLDALAKDEKKPFYCEGTPHAGIHRRLLRRAGMFDREAENHSLVSYRQEGRYCLQVVVAPSPGGAGNHYADLDIDLGNPLQDVQGLLIHLGEVLNPGYTDHLSLQEYFATGATADFMYYTVRKN